MKTVIWSPDTDHSLNPLTRLLPKAVVPVLNRPMLEYYLFQAEEIPSSQIILLTDPKGNRFGHYYHYKNDPRWNESLSTVLSAQSYHSFSALKAIQNSLNETFLFIDANVFALLNWQDLVLKHLQSHALISVIYVPFNPIKDLFALKMNTSNRLTEISRIEKSQSNTQINLLTNCYLFEPQIVRYFQNPELRQINSDLIPFLLKEKQPVNAIQGNGIFEPLSSLYYYAQLNLSLLENGALDRWIFASEMHNRIFIGMNCSVKSRVKEDFVEPVLIGNHTKIGRGVTVRGPAVIGNHVKLSKGAVVDRSVILDHTYIGKMVEIKNSVIAKNCYISVKNLFGTFIEEDFILSEYHTENVAIKLRRYFWAIFDRIFVVTLLIFFTTAIFNNCNFN